MNLLRRVAACDRRLTAKIAGLLLTAVMLPAQQLPPVPPTAGVLAKLVADDAQQRIAALRELAAGVATRPTLEAVALALFDPALEVRNAAVETLVVLRQDLRRVRPKLREIVSVPKPMQWQAARFALGGLVQAPNPQRHLAGLVDEDASVRRKAVVALCALGSAAAPHEEDLLALLHDPDADVRAAVAKNVSAIGWNDGIRDAVIDAIKDTSAAVRNGAAEGLGSNGNDPEVVAALRSAVQDPDLDVRAQVLRSLGHSGEAGAAAAADIVASLRDREAKVRVAALEAVRELRLSGKRAVRDSIRCLDETDGKVLVAALRMVEVLGQTAGSTMPRIVELMNHARAEVRRRALFAAWAAVDPAQRGSVALRSVEALLDEDRKVANSAQHLLGLFVNRER